MQIILEENVLCKVSVIFCLFWAVPVSASDLPMGAQNEDQHLESRNQIGEEASRQLPQFDSVSTLNPPSSFWAVQQFYGDNELDLLDPNKSNSASR